MKRVLTKTKKGILLVVLVTTVLQAGLFIVLQQIKTYPLGNDLEYVGKSDYGCYLLCDANPDSTLYYASDLSIDDLMSHFAHAKATYVSGDTWSSNGYNYKNIEFTTLRSNQTFFASWYNDGEKVANTNNLDLRGKKHIISFSRSTYQTAKDSL